MKNHMQKQQWNLLISVYLMILTSNTVLKKSRHQHKLQSKCKSTYWQSSISENIIRTSTSSPCNDALVCRSWSQILNIAACKTKKISEILDSDMKLYYIQTIFKTEAQDEWAKLMYSIVENESMDNMKTNIKKGAFLLRVCVSVEKKYTAWADDRCPLDDCMPYEKFLTKKDCQHTDQTKQELNQDMDHNFKPLDAKFNQKDARRKRMMMMRKRRI